MVMDMEISIHTALAGCDRYGHTGGGLMQVFQSTQPSQAVTIGWILII